VPKPKRQFFFKPSLLTTGILETSFTRCCAIYDEDKVVAITPYPYVAETLSALRDRELKLAVVTDAHNGNAQKRLRNAGLEEFFDALIPMDMSGKSKPSSEPFLLAMEKPSVSADETMLVEDSIRRDIVPAKARGMLAVYGDRNFHEGERNEADWVIRGIWEGIPNFGGDLNFSIYPQLICMIHRSIPPFFVQFQQVKDRHYTKKPIVPSHSNQDTILPALREFHEAFP